MARFLVSVKFTGLLLVNVFGVLFLPALGVHIENYI
jgi:hypothetical protein